MTVCNQSNIDFANRLLTAETIRDASVLEVGSRDVNGSVRNLVLRHKPSNYVGVDIEEGPGVDEICDIGGLLTRFGRESFDVVISTEVIEHVRDWRSAVSQLKNVLRPRGLLLLTTRSRGFPYHGYPADYWRYEMADLRALFVDLEIETLEPDPLEPGVLLAARRPVRFSEVDLGTYSLYSMVTETRRRRVTTADILLFRLRTRFLRRLIASARYRIGRIVGG